MERAQRRGLAELRERSGLSHSTSNGSGSLASTREAGSGTAKTSEQSNWKRKLGLSGRSGAGANGQNGAPVELARLVARWAAVRRRASWHRARLRRCCRRADQWSTGVPHYGDCTRCAVDRAGGLFVVAAGSTLARARHVSGGVGLLQRLQDARDGARGMGRALARRSARAHQAGRLAVGGCASFARRHGSDHLGVYRCDGCVIVLASISPSSKGFVIVSSTCVGIQVLHGPN